MTIMGGLSLDTDTASSGKDEEVTQQPDGHTRPSISPHHGAADEGLVRSDAECVGPDKQGGMPAALPEEDEGGDGHYDEAAGVYRLVSRRRYRPGEQVFLCYGRHSNLELLELYGFVLDDNPHGEREG